MPDDPVALTSDEPSHPTRKLRRRLMLGLVGVGVVATTAVVALMFWRDDAADTPATADEPPRLVDATTGAGIDHVYDGEFEFFVGGGVATFDCDADGRPDLFLAGGAERAALYRNESQVGGELRFVQHTSPLTDLTQVTGAYPLDIDGDGNVDLAILRRGGNVLLRGLGGCGFESATEKWGLDAGEDWTTAFSATWEGSNRLPTLAFGSYLEPDDDEFACGVSRLVRPSETGDGYAPAVPLDPGYCTLSMLFSDWNRSGERDLRVTNDRHYSRDGREQLWQMVPDSPAREYTESDGWLPLRIWGMGIASHDLTGDGYPEVFITSQGDNKLQTLADGPDDPTYRDIALRRGVTAQRPFTGGDVLPSTAWHPEFADVNNDGFVDLFVSKGNVEAQPDHATRDPSNLLIGQADGTFVEGAEAAGIVDFDRARGAAVVDLNLDGMLDLVVVKRRENVTLWRNVGDGDRDRPAPMGHRIAVRLRQPAPNVDAVGAWLEVEAEGRTIVREITVGGGHVGGQHGWVHVGIGEATSARVRVQWPDGETGPWTTIDGDRFVTLERGSARPTPWTLPD